MRVLAGGEHAEQRDDCGPDRKHAERERAEPPNGGSPHRCREKCTDDCDCGEHCTQRVGELRALRDVEPFDEPDAARLGDDPPDERGEVDRSAGPRHQSAWTHERGGTPTELHERGQREHDDCSTVFVVHANGRRVYGTGRERRARCDRERRRDCEAVSARSFRVPGCNCGRHLFPLAHAGLDAIFTKLAAGQPREQGVSGEERSSENAAQHAHGDRCALSEPALFGDHDVEAVCDGSRTAFGAHALVRATAEREELHIGDRGDGRVMREAGKRKNADDGGGSVISQQALAA